MNQESAVNVEAVDRQSIIQTFENEKDIQIVKDGDLTMSFIKESADSYLHGGVMGSSLMKALQAPSAIKLALLQITPANKVGSLKIAGQNIPYVNVRYIERCLNFAFSFSWGGEVVEHAIEHIGQTKSGNNENFAAMVKMNMYANFNDGNGNIDKITATVFGSMKHTQNAAVNKFDALKKARSNAIKNFARNFGIGADVDIVSQESINAVRNKSFSESWENEFQQDIS